MSRLLGREPVERHEQYDQDGNLIGYTLVSRDPEFTRADVALMLASRRLQGELNAYGIPAEEAMDAANQFAYEVQEKPRIDWAEKAVKDAMDKFYEDRPKGESRNGHKWGRVKRRDS